MKKPKKIVILGKTYKIKYLKKLSKRGEVGHISTLNRIIEIKKCDKEIMESALLHEVIHGILMELGFGDEINNEHLVCSLETGLYQVLKENSIFSF